MLEPKAADKVFYVAINVATLVKRLDTLLGVRFGVLLGPKRVLRSLPLLSHAQMSPCRLLCRLLSLFPSSYLLQPHLEAAPSLLLSLSLSILSFPLSYIGGPV